MTRSESRVEDGVLAVQDGDGWLEVGEMDALVTLVGGETYEIEYDREQASAATWLDADDDHVVSFDVRETLADMSYPATFVETLREEDGESSGESPSPRATYFADVMTDVWDSKGNLDDREENPFR